jgi:hypothetical protein
MTNQHTPRGRAGTKAPPPSGEGRKIEIPRTLTVKDLSDLVEMSPVDVIKELIKNGVMADEPGHRL